MRWDKMPAEQLGEQIAKANGSLHIFTSFLTIAPLAGFLEDRKARVLFLSPEAETLWKLKTKEARGKTMLELGLGIDAKEHNAKVLRHNTGQVFFYVSNDPATKRLRDARYSVLRFPCADSDGDRLIGGLVVPTWSSRA